MANSMMSRFEGEDGRRRLAELLRTHVLMNGDGAVADQVAAVCELIEVGKGDVLIRQDAADNDLYLVLAGSVRIVINGRDVALRSHGQHVGEMAIVDPSAPRSATVIANESALVAKVSEANFHRLANENTALWRAIALQLCRRLSERKQFHAQPNLKPVMFIGSSKEQLPIAEALASAIPTNIADVVIWSEGVFEPSHFVMDDLDAQLRSADFAALITAGDDQVTSRGTQSNAPRDNIVFELGLFMGALSRFRTFLVSPKGAGLKIPSDLLGLNPVLYDGSATDPAVAIKGAAQEIIQAISKIGSK